MLYVDFYLIEELSVVQNISLAFELQEFPRDKINSKVEEILFQVGLKDYQNRKISEISGGGKQRIASLN